MKLVVPADDHEPPAFQTITRVESDDLLTLADAVPPRWPAGHDFHHSSARILGNDAYLDLSGTCRY